MDKAIVERFALRYLEEIATKLYELQLNIDKGLEVRPMDLMPVEIKTRVIMKVIREDAIRRGVMQPAFDFVKGEDE